MSLWLDDERPMPREYDIHVRTQSDAIEVLRNGMVVIADLDCDLGEGNGSGYEVARWITEQWEADKLRYLTVYCHSANPVERRAIEMLLERAWERIK